MSEIIRTNNISKNYGSFTALRDMNITIKKGDISLVRSMAKSNFW